MTVSKWDYAAVIAAMILIGVNGVAGYAFITGKINWEQWLAAAGLFNGPALGWVGKQMEQPKQNTTAG